MAGLVAMAGERLRPVGYTEISAVCTHPGYRGRGYGRDLVETLVRNIIDRGDVPILHVEKDNRAASLYEKVGFSIRQTIHLVGLRKPNFIEVADISVVSSLNECHQLMRSQLKAREMKH
jgi:ribosomal protein S18 acetylase RimI-like enzyme